MSSAQNRKLWRRSSSRLDVDRRPVSLRFDIWRDACLGACSGNPRHVLAGCCAALVIAIIGGISAAAAAAQSDWAEAGQRWWSHVQYLASDELQGRETGSAG